MSDLTNILATASGENNLDWTFGKIVGLIVGTNKNLHFRALFQNASTGKQKWMDIPEDLYSIAKVAYVNSKSTYVQGDLETKANIFSILVL